jgi:hypothetical protein
MQELDAQTRAERSEMRRQEQEQGMFETEAHVEAAAAELGNDMDCEDFDDDELPC